MKINQWLYSLVFLGVMVVSGPMGLDAAEPQGSAKVAKSGPGAVPAGVKSGREVKRAPYQFLRQNENWSYLAGGAPSDGADFFDPIKYVPVNESGSVWLSFGGHLWARGENWNNFGFLDDPSREDSFGVGRLLFHTDVRVGKHFRAFVELKSSMATQRNLPGGRRTLDVDEADFQQAFVDVGIPIADKSKLTFRAGRQQLLFGKQRLVSPLPWGNSLRTFDGFSGILTAGSWKVHSFWTRPVPVRKFELNRLDHKTQFYGAYSSGKLKLTGGGMDIYWLGLDRRNAAFNGKSGRERRQTVGARLFGKMPKRMDYDLETTYQFGSVGVGDINAASVASQVGWRPADVSWQPRIYGGFDYASGDDGRGQDVGTFNQLFPLGHAFLGFMDTVGRQNIVDASAGFSMKPHRRLSTAITHHNFWRANEADALYHAGGGVVRAGGPGTPKWVGSELDFTTDVKMSRHAVVTLGYSRFFAGDFIKATGPSDNVNFLYAWLRYTM